MRRLAFGSQYKRDLRKSVKQGRKTEDLLAVIRLLQADAQISDKYHDHALHGNWEGYRDIHVSPDWLLIYKKIGDDILALTRLGSYAELYD